MDRLAGEMRTKMCHMQRDLKNFEECGITQEKVEILLSDLQRFKNMPTDEEL